MRKYAIGLILLAGIGVLIGIGGSFSRSAGKDLQALLQSSGFTTSTLPASQRQGKGYLYKSAILDVDGFSTIDSLTINTSWLNIFRGKPYIDSVSIEGLTLTGNFDETTLYEIAGWQPQSRYMISALPDITLQNGQLDLMTPSGAIRLEADGALTRMDAETQTLRGHVKAKQNQLTLDSRWNSQIQKDGSWRVAGDITEGRLNLDHLRANRISGWVTVDNTYAIAAHLVAGRLQLGGQTDFSQASLTLDRQGQDSKLLFKGNALQDAITMTFDIIGGPTPKVMGVIEARDADSLIIFLESLKQDLDLFQSQKALMTSLLITEGNMNRIRRELKPLEYDHLRLVIEGTPADLSGKILARKLRNGVYQSQVLSLNPSARR